MISNPNARREPRRNNGAAATLSSGLPALFETLKCCARTTFESHRSGDRLPLELRPPRLSAARSRMLGRVSVRAQSDRTLEWLENRPWIYKCPDPVRCRY